MRKIFKLTLMTALLAVLLVSPALAKKAPIERTVVDGVTLAEVKVNTQVPPYYPATARMTKSYGEVVMAVEVNEKGRVADVEVLASVVEGLGFEESAEDAIKAWRFHPALEGGEAISSVSVIRLSFAPPSLGSPEGYVFTETSGRFYSARTYNPVQASGRAIDQIRAAADPFVRAAGANPNPRESIHKADLPPCRARRNYNECMYDRKSMIQFGGKPDAHPIPVPGVK